MVTKIGKEEIIKECAELIKKGEIVAFPTETVYGLGANALDENAVKKIFVAKNRPSDNPFIVHVNTIEDAEKVAFVTEDAKKIFEKFSPGPITVVLKKKPIVPDCVTAGLDTVGIRMPSHRLAQEFLRECGVPIAAPSANVSKKVSPTEAQFVYDDLNGKIPAIIDGGRCDVGIESTVISLAGDRPIILRPGAITKEMLEEHITGVSNFSGKVDVAPAPGMKYVHYSPIVPCVLYRTTNGAMTEYDLRQAEGKNPIILAESEDCKIFNSKGYNCVDLGKDSNQFMHEIFAKLRICEKKYDYIIVQALGNEGVEYGIMNRLLKSSGGVIV